jgi:hypothetical protein
VFSQPSFWISFCRGYHRLRQHWKTFCGKGKGAERPFNTLSQMYEVESQFFAQHGDGKRND